MPCDKVYNGRATTYHFFSDGSAIDIESILVIMRKIIVKILRARLAHLLQALLLSISRRLLSKPDTYNFRQEVLR